MILNNLTIHIKIHLFWFNICVFLPFLNIYIGFVCILAVSNIHFIPCF